jgi:hypothetical protein
MKEAELQKTILDYLALKKHLAFKHRNVGIFKQATGRYIPLPARERGISDILGLTPTGRFFAIEVKTQRGTATDEQKRFLEEVRAHGGIAVLARSLDDVIRAGL